MERRHGRGVAWNGAWRMVSYPAAASGDERRGTIVCDAHATYSCPTCVTPNHGRDVGLLVAVHCEGGSMLMRVLWP